MTRPPPPAYQLISPPAHRKSSFVSKKEKVNIAALEHPPQQSPLKPCDLVPTAAERQRFITYWGDDNQIVEDKLKAYMEYREKTLPIAEDSPSHGDGRVPPWLRLLVRTAEDGSEEFVRCKKTGNRVVYLFGGYYNKEVPPGDYIAALGKFLEENLSRDSDEAFTVIIDARAGNGPLYKNAPVTDLAQFFQEMSALYQVAFPGRIDRTIVVPMPYFAYVLWQGISYFLPTALANGLIFISGSAAVGSPLPSELSEYIDSSDCPPISEGPVAASSGLGSWLGLS